MENALMKILLLGADAAVDAGTPGYAGSGWRICRLEV